MKKVLVTLISLFTLTSVFGQDYQVAGGPSKTNNSIPVVYKIGNAGTAGSGVLMISGSDTTALIGKSGFLGIGTIAPTETFSVDGSAIIVGDNYLFQSSNDLFNLSNVFGPTFTIAGVGAQAFTSPDSSSWVFMKVSDDSNVEGDTVAAIGYVDANTFYEMYYQVDKRRIRTFAGSEDGGVGYSAENGDGSMYFFANSTLDFDTPNKTIELFDNGNISIDVNGAVFNITDGNQALGKVLTSDASGNASWANINTVDASTIPVYANNAAAVAAIGAGKFYYVDVLGEYEVRISH